jgi:hypothetical protein
MKVYVNGYNYKEKILDYDTSYKTSYLYTTDGIYLYKEKDKNTKKTHDKTHDKSNEFEIKKIEYKGETTERKYKEYHFLIDNTKIEYSDSLYHIPYLHLFCEEITYKKKMDGFYFVKTSYFDQVDYYFEIDSIDDVLFEKMITFLSSN